MTTVTLPDNLTEPLQRKANQWNISIDAAATRLIGEALSREETMPDVHDSDDLPSLEEVTARIKALPPDPTAFHPPTKPLHHLLAELERNPPPASDISPEEWDRLWAEFEEKLKEIDRADDIAEGRL